MGMVYANIELVNADDLALVRNNIIGEEEIKRLTINACVDSGAYMMCINDDVQSILQLPFIEQRTAVMADGSVQTFDTVGPLMIKFKNRTAMCNAYVLKGSAEPLLGAIPMEEMDVLIHPLRNELVVNPEHPDYAVLKLYGLK